MQCKYCGKTLKKGSEFFQDPKFKTKQYCNEEEHDLFYASQPKKEPKEQEVKKVSDFRKLTDYIDAIWSDEVNWVWFTSQIKNLAKSTGLSYNDMRITLRYCVEFLDMQPDPAYGLQQFIPKYTKDAMDFKEDIQRIKDSCSSIDFDDEISRVQVDKVNTRRIQKWDFELDS